MDFRGLRDAALAAAILSMTSAVPLAYSAVVPDLPSDATEVQVADWVAENLETPAEAMVVREGVTFVFAEVLGIQPTAEGLITNVRVELGEVLRSPRMAGSIKERMEFDCTSPRVRLHSSRTFGDHRGEGAEYVVDHSSEWVQVGAGDPRRTLRDRVCRLAPFARTPDWTAALPPAPIDESEAAATAWASHLRMGDEAVAARGHEGLYLLDPQGIEKVSEGRIRFALRTERFRPIGSANGFHRSSRRQVEVDCNRKRYILETTEEYPAANLMGQPARKSEDAVRWREALAGEDEVRWIRAACTLSLAPNTPSADTAGEAEAPPPANLSREDVWGWIGQNLNIQGYAPQFSHAGGATLYRMRGISLRPNGNVVVGERRESFAPIATPLGTIRSEFSRIEYDCRAYKRRVLSTTLYAQSNLEGRAFAGPKEGWSEAFPEGSNGRAQTDRLCGLRGLVASGADLSLALPPPPRSLEDEEMDAWLEQYVQPGKDALAGYGPQGVWLYSTTELERTGAGFVRAWTRIERFEPSPDGARSQRLLQEFDCAESRSRILMWRLYPGANLIGDKRDVQDGGAWKFHPPDSLQSRIGKAVCAAMKEQEEAASVPRLPRPSTAPAI